MSKIRRQVRTLFESHKRDFTVTYSGAPGQLTWFSGDVSPEENTPMGRGGRKSRVCRSHAPKTFHSKMGSREAASSNKKALTEEKCSLLDTLGGVVLGSLKILEKGVLP